MTIALSFKDFSVYSWAQEVYVNVHATIKSACSFCALFLDILVTMYYIFFQFQKYDSKSQPTLILRTVKSEF